MVKRKERKKRKRGAIPVCSRICWLLPFVMIRSVPPVPLKKKKHIFFHVQSSFVVFHHTRKTLDIFFFFFFLNNFNILKYIYIDEEKEASSSKA